MDELPDFSLWKTTRLEFLLVEYKESLASVKEYYGGGHEETRDWQRWVAGLEAELASRKATK